LAKFGTFEEIDAWQEARKLTRQIYSMTEEEPISKDRGLKDQIRRASVSIMSNIAEGFERRGNKEFIHYLYTAKGSAGEVRSQLYVIKDQGYLSEDSLQNLLDKADKISRMLNSLIAYLENEM